MRVTALADHDPLDPRQVALAAHASESPRRRMSSRDRFGLAGAHLERHQPHLAALRQGHEQRADARQPVGPGEQRRGGLVAQDLGRERGALGLGDIRRVGEHRVELVRDAGEQVRVQPAHVEAEPPPVGPGELPARLR